MSICPPSGLIPRLENDATASAGSSAATAMIEGQFAGCDTGLVEARAARVVARGRDDQRAHGLRPQRDALVDLRERLAGPGRRAERHRDDGALVGDRPLDAGQDPGVRARAGVGEHLAGVDLGAVGDAVARAARRRALAAERGADAVRAVAVAVLHRLAGHEGARLDRAAGEVRVLEVEARVEHRHPDLRARAAAVDDLRRLQAPGRLGLVERGDLGQRRGPGTRRGLLGEVQYRVAVAAQVVGAAPAAGRGGDRHERRDGRRLGGTGRRRARQHGVAVGGVGRLGDLEREHDPLGLDGEDRAAPGGLHHLLGRRVDDGDAERLEDLRATGARRRRRWWGRRPPAPRPCPARRRLPRRARGSVLSWDRRRS